MYDEITTPGIVLTSMPVGEYDRRVSVLTARQGRISAFARGARRATSTLCAPTVQFTYADFTFAERRDSYDLKTAENIRSFDRLASDMDAVLYASYFCELVSFLTRENADETEQLKLLYMTFAALGAGTIDHRLIRCIFELRSITEYGEAMRAEGLYYSQNDNGLVEYNAAGSIKVDTSTLHTVQFVESTPVNKLFTFRVSDTVLNELERITGDYMKRHVDRPMKSLEVLRQMTGAVIPFVTEPAGTSD